MLTVKAAMFIGSNIVTFTVLHIICHITKSDFGFDPSRSSKVKSDNANRKPMAVFKEVLPDVQTCICHSFQDISNQRIVTLTFNLPRSSKVKPMSNHIISVGSNTVTLAFLEIFHVKKYDLMSDPLWSSKVKSDGANQKTCLLYTSDAADE